MQIYDEEEDSLLAALDPWVRGLGLRVSCLLGPIVSGSARNPLKQDIAPIEFL